jgi:hypothetical protein
LRAELADDELHRLGGDGKWPPVLTEGRPKEGRAGGERDGLVLLRQRARVRDKSTGSRGRRSRSASYRAGGTRDGEHGPKARLGQVVWVFHRPYSPG